MRAEKIGRRLFETREIEEEDSTRFPGESSRRTRTILVVSARPFAASRYSLSHSPLLETRPRDITSMLSLIGIPFRFFRFVVFPFVRLTSTLVTLYLDTWIR